MEIKDIIALKERQFVETRLLISQWVETFMKNVREVDPALLAQEGIILPEGNTAEELLPSLYAPNFDITTYEAEKAKFDQLQSKFNILADKLNEEALRCLSE